MSPEKRRYIRIPIEVRDALLARNEARDALQAATEALQAALAAYAGETFDVEGVPVRVCHSAATGPSGLATSIARKLSNSLRITSKAPRLGKRRGWVGVSRGFRIPRNKRYTPLILPSLSLPLEPLQCCS